MACVEECPDPVVGEVPEPERSSFDAFDEVVDRFGGPVGHERVVPGGDLVGPALEGAAELLDLEGCLVLEVGCELADPRQSGARVTGQVDVTDTLLSVNRP